MAAALPPDPSVQGAPTLSIYLAKAAHDVQTNCPRDVWLGFLKAFSALTDNEILSAVRGEPGVLLDYKQGRGRLAYQLNETIDQCSKIWLQWRDNQEKKDTKNANAGRTRPTIG